MNKIKIPSCEGGLYLSNSHKRSKENQPLISVVIVIYNGATFLEDAILSIVNQSYTNIELIIIDGASKDGTIDILKKYDTHIDYWLSEPDSGQSDAFNKGFNLCNGDLLTWLNADELYTPDAIQNVATSLIRNPTISWFTAGLVFTDHELNILKMRMGESGGYILNKLGILNVYGSSTFFTKELFEKAGGMNISLNYTMDTDLWWRFISMGATFKRIKHYICIYRLHSKSKTGKHVVLGQNRDRDHQLEIERIIKVYQKDSKRHLIYSTILRCIFRTSSFSYIKSIIDSKIYKNKNAINIFKINNRNCHNPLF